MFSTKVSLILIEKSILLMLSFLLFPMKITDDDCLLQAILDTGLRN
jgi:hypothetical protein